MKYRWNLKPVDDLDALARLQHDLNSLPEPLARALIHRGVATLDQARLFFRSSTADLHDPFQMADMAAAAARIARAKEKGEAVLVYGDYDVDGTTATALMTSFLRDLGIQADYFIPDRIADGYGFKDVGVDTALELGASLIVALDCGITSHAPARYARERGVDLIICDHHTPEETYPDAAAVLNPKRRDCLYPFKELSGCGVGFKLAQAVLAHLGREADRAYEYMDLVAVSIASDIVPLYGENRVIMREGLERLRTSPREGIRQLAQLARLDLATASTQNLVFGIGPRINAAGRMGDAGRAAALMLEPTEAGATRLAFELEQANNKRRALDQDTMAEAERMAQEIQDEYRHGLVLLGRDWHPGVVGIVASRITERFHRPAVLLCRAGDVVKGSVRSFGGVNVYEALTACSDLLSTFGGHMFAAGVSLLEDNVPLFRRRFDEAVRDLTAAEPLLPEIDIDAPLDLTSVDKRFWNVLRQFAPHGPHNDQPVFQGGGLQVVGQVRPVGKTGDHLKFAVRQESGGEVRAWDVIAFDMSAAQGTLQQSQRLGIPLEMAFNVQENTWNGSSTLQLRAKDVRLQTENSREASLIGR